MKITGYRVEQYLMRMDRLVGDANLPEGMDLMPGSILYLDTDEGITGIALGFGGGVKELFDAVEGRDPREVSAHWIRMNDILHKAGNQGAATFAFSAIDTALWDLKAKAANEPLWKTLGAVEGRVKVYASGLDYSLSDDDLFQFYRRMAERGVDAGKLKVGLDLRADLRRLGIMQDALTKASPRPQLMIDANEYWSPKQAVRYVRQLEAHFDLTWVEEPARRWDTAGLKQVSEQIGAAVATGENLRSIAEIQPLIAGGAVDVINLSTNHSGVTGCRQIAHLAQVYGLPVSMNNCQANFMAQVAAALPNHGRMEVVDPGGVHCLCFESLIEDGYLHLSSAPGFGIEVDEQKLKELQADPPTGQGRFPFPRREGAARYIVPPKAGEVPWKGGR